MMQTILDQVLCTGCSACVAGCPFDVLVLDFDENGFYRPRLNGDSVSCKQCGKCVKICPLHTEVKPTKINRKKPDCFAFDTDEQTSFPSSTAGGFQLIAKTFLAETNSVVTGAAWEGLTVKHILIDNLEDLPKLYKSKYVQSFMGDILVDTKSALENGKRVLFTGTPCQIAGLYTFIAAQPQAIQTAAEKNLYSIDILCHAAPPPQVFERYLEETFGTDNVLEYSFRAKEDGCAFGYGGKLKLRVKLKNQSILFLTMQDDLFGKLFLRDIAMGKHCEQCRFAAYPRCGDVSLADFWCIEQSDPQFQSGRTEAVLVNSTKGDELIRPISASATKWKKQPLGLLLNGNDIAVDSSGRKAHPNRDRFFSYMKRMSITQAGNACANNSYDIGLVGLPNNANYGGGLTYYALYHALQDMGKSVLLINPPLNTSHGRLLQNRTGWKHDPYLPFDVAPSYKNKTLMRQLNDKCDMFLVGSDQLFATNGMYVENGKFVSLDWVFDYKTKSAYAASFCNGYITCSEHDRIEMGYYLSLFDYFSVREKSGVELCKREFNVQADWVLDPVFLCDRKHYESLIIENGSSVPSLSCYILVPHADVSQMIENVASKLSLQANVLGDTYGYETPPQIEEWLSAFYHADFVVTDSFHGTCFCLIFNKPFIVFSDSRDDNQYRTPERMQSILELVGLQDRLVSNYAGYEKLQNRLMDIDWTAVNRKLDEAKRQSFAALEKAATPLKKQMSHRDIVWLETQARERENSLKVRLLEWLKRLYDSRWARLPRAVARRIRRRVRQSMAAYSRRRKS